MKFLTIKNLMKRYQVSRQCIYTWIEKGTIPKPVKFNATIRWNIETIEAWEKRVEEGK